MRLLSTNPAFWFAASLITVMALIGACSNVDPTVMPVVPRDTPTPEVTLAPFPTATPTNTPTPTPTATPTRDGHADPHPDGNANDDTGADRHTRAHADGHASSDVDADPDAPSGCHVHSDARPDTVERRPAP